MKVVIGVIFMAIGFLANSQNISSSKSTKIKSSNTSVSIQNSDSAYIFKASFDSDKNKKLKTILMDNLDKKYLIVNGETLIWQKNDTDGIVYNITFKKGSLKMNVDKELISGNASKKFEILGRELSNIISGN